MSKPLTILRKKHNPSESQEEFAAKRRSSIGGSDIHHVLQLEPYGCYRRLILDKLGFLPEDSAMSHHIERGKFFEGPVADLYQSRTLREVRLCGPGTIQEMPWFTANADRLQTAEGKPGVGVLEIKCPGEWSFKRMKKEGISQGYLAQLNYQMLCYGTSWGTIAVYWPDGHELVYFDFERDEEIIQNLYSNVTIAGRLISRSRDSGADQDNVIMVYEGRKECDRVCAKCPMQAKCWPEGPARGEGKFQMGAASIALGGRYSDLNQRAKNLAKELEETKAQLLATLREEGMREDAGEALSDGFKITFRTQVRESLSPKVKEVLTPEQIAEYTKQTTFDVMSVKLIGDKE